VIAIRDAGSTRLFTRNGYDISRRHRHLTELLDALPADRFVLDGKLVVLDDDGRSNFGKLMFGRTGTHYFAFDLLMLGFDRPTPAPAGKPQRDAPRTTAEQRPRSLLRPHHWLRQRFF
jgi:bifunctional non-homologous end joining protein LigD